MDDPETWDCVFCPHKVRASLNIKMEDWLNQTQVKNVDQRWISVVILAI